MAIAVSLRTAHFDVKDAERDSVRPVCAGKRSLGGYARELRPDLVAENAGHSAVGLHDRLSLRDGLKSSGYGRSRNQANALLKPVNALLASPGNRALFRKFYVRPSMICSTDALGGLDEPRAQPGEPSTAPAAVPSASIRAGSDAHLPVQRVDPSLSLARDPAGVGAHARRGALCECGSTRDDSCSPGNQPIKH